MMARLAAERAGALLRAAEYPAQHIAAIEAHSFSARVAPQTIEAKVVQVRTGSRLWARWESPAP